MWRPANRADDDSIVRMCLALNAEDPGPAAVPEKHVRKTLDVLRTSPSRGVALVLEVDGASVGYAFLISFWSNELGGEVCTVDELYVTRAHRGQQHATRLLEDIAARRMPFFRAAVAIALETTPGNDRARRLYERVGLQARNIAMRRKLSDPPRA